ncbi:MAG: PAS domain S-box protein [Ignavibacteriales bacterium]
MVESKRTILLVEDEAIIALTEKLWLRNEGFDVIHAPSGEMAIKTVRDNNVNIDLILMDIDLGRNCMDGTEAAREILRDHDIPLLFLSSHTEKEIVDRTEQISSYGYVVKGSNNTVLLASIKMAFKLHKAHRDLIQKDKSLQETQSSYRALADYLTKETRSPIDEEVFIQCEKKYKYLFENNPQAMWVYDIETLKFLDVNRSALDRYGYSRDEFLNMTIRDIRPDDDLDKLMQDVAATTAVLYNAGVWRHKKRNGEIIFVEIKSHLIEHQGRIARIVLTNDITGYKRTEETVSLLSHTLKSVSQGINITDMNNKIIFVNQAFLNIYGYSEKEVLNHHINMVRADEEINYQAINNGTVSGGWHGELLNRKKDGTVFPIFLSTSVVRDENSEPIALVGVVTDITERRNTEHVLRMSEEKYRGLVDKMLDGVYKSTHEGKFLEVNPAMVKMLGYDSKEDLMAIDIKSQLYFETSERESAALQEKLEEMAIFRLKKKDGSEIWVEDHGRHILDTDGNVLYHEGIMRDVTERIDSELRLQKFTAELKESNATKDKFFSILAHDLRGPFLGFMGITEDLTNHIDMLSKEEIVEYAKVMHSTSQKIFELLTNLLEWSRLQTGRIDFHPHVINLFQEVESIRNLFSSAAAGKSVSLNSSINNSTYAIADSNMVSAILRNMVSNALKFTNPGGIITIGAKAAGSFVEVSVADNGIGMTEEEVDKIFRIDSGFTKKGTEGEEGTGFGLVLCKEMIEKNGGEIRVSSIPGQGTNFLFTLPIADNFQSRNN